MQKDQIFSSDLQAYYANAEIKMWKLFIFINSVTHVNQNHMGVTIFIGGNYFRRFPVFF